MSGKALVVMAAGLGSRYGGLKQLERVDDTGHTILDYSAYDAIQEGFSSIVFVIRRSIEEQFRQSVGERIGQHVDVAYAFQDEPENRRLAPPSRGKPWGTGHAVLVAAGTLAVPFGVINADDFYGRESFRLLARGLDSIPDNDAVLIAFRLANTLSEHGTVKRGLCSVDGQDRLLGVVEHESLEMTIRGVEYRSETGERQYLTGNELVSMNMWGFGKNFEANLESRWEAFLSKSSNLTSAEFYIPNAVTELMDTGTLTCTVQESSCQWFGVTYPEDLGKVRKNIQSLAAAGIYPRHLWAV